MTGSTSDLMALNGIEYALAVVIAVYLLFSKYILFVSDSSALLIATYCDNLSNVWYHCTV